MINFKLAFYFLNTQIFIYYEHDEREFNAE